MTLHLVIAFGLAVTTAFAAEPISRRLAPRTATRLLAAGAVLSWFLVEWVLVSVTVGGLGEVAWLSDRLGWCRPVTRLSHQVPLPMAAAAAALLGVIVGRGALRWRAWRKVTGGGAQESLTVLPTDEPFAYALPGRPGGIVATRGLLAVLDADERRAMLAHEQAHLDHAHHRYLRAAELSASFPLLGPLAGAVRFATERWADEEAAAAVGDRRVVARALSRAALASAGPVPAGVGGLLGAGMSERVTELLAGAPGRLDLAQRVLLVSSVAGLLAAAGLTLRMHDLVAVLAHVCGAG